MVGGRCHLIANEPDLSDQAAAEDYQRADKEVPMSPSRLLALVAIALAVPVSPAFADPHTEALPPDAVLQRFDGTAHVDDIATDIAVDPVTGIAVVAGWVGSSPGAYDIGAVAYAADGSQLWQRVITAGEGFGKAVGIDSSRGIVYVAGDHFTDASGTNYLVTAYSLAGVQLWQRRYDSGGGAAIYGLRVDEPRGRVLVTGQGGSSAQTIAYSSTGQQLWVAQYSEPNRQVFASDVAIDPRDGSVYLAAAAGGSGTYGFRVVAYTADGVRRWVDGLDPTSASTSSATVLEVEPATGTVYVVGFVSRPHTRHDVVTAAYTPSGTRTWMVNYDGFGSADAPTAMVLDPRSGRIFISANSSGPSGEDYLTLAYGPAGALLWADRQPATENGDNYPTDIAVDSSRGRVFVTGQTRLDQRGLDYATVSYTVGGTYLGRSLYDGPPGGGSDTATALAVDLTRHTVWVAGRSQGDGGDEDWATIAYPG